MMRHISFARNPGFTGAPDLSALDGVVASEILNAMSEASSRLSRLNIRHGLIGGLAVGAYGVPRATKDVDFLVGDEAFVQHAGGVISIAPGVPIQVGRVAVDTLSIFVGEEHLGASISVPKNESVPVVPVSTLIYLKLKSPRAKDSSDIVELLKVGVSPQYVRNYLKKNAPVLYAKFERLVVIAEEES